MGEIFKKEKEKDEIFYSSGESSNNPLAEKLAGLRAAGLGELKPQNQGERKKVEEPLKSQEQSEIKSEEKMGIEPQERQEQQKPFTRQDAENIIKTAFGEDVFKREEKGGNVAGKETGSQKEKHYIYKEIDRIEKNIGSAKKELKSAKTDEEKKKAEEKIQFFISELKKAKEARDRVFYKKEESKIDFESKKESRLQLQSDIAEIQPKTYGDVYSKKSIPDDALEEGFKQKEMKVIERFKNPEEKEGKIEIISPIGVRILSEEKIEEAKQARESLGKTRERIAEFEKATESQEELRGAFEKISVEQKELEEKCLVNLGKQEEKIEQEIKKEKPWIREKVEKAAEWYKKQPFWKKALFSVSCLGAASASAAIGGAVGAAVATAAFTGSISQRALGGLATFVMAEGALKKAAEKGGKERTKADVIRHTVEAAVLGILVGSGSAAKAAKEISDATGITDIFRESYNFWFASDTYTQAPIQEAPPVKASAPIEPAPKAEALFEKHLEYQGGKSIWQEAEKQLSVRLKEQFENLGSDDVKSAEALKTYNIDRMKDAIVNAIQNNDEALMGKYNLSGIDPDHITAEQLKNINWDKAFEDVFSENKLTAELEPGQIESITKNNATLRQFFSEHSRAPRTIENYEAILKGKGVTGELPSELPTGPKPIKVPPEYFDGSKKMLYKEQLDELNEKYPAKEIPFSNVQNWLEDKAKIDVEKSSWLNEKSLERLKIKDVIDSGFAKPQGVEAYTTAAPEWGSSQWWEMKEKTELQEKIGKILRAMSSEERIKFQNNSVLDFLKNYLKTGGK